MTMMMMMINKINHGSFILIQLTLICDYNRHFLYFHHFRNQNHHQDQSYIRGCGYNGRLSLIGNVHWNILVYPCNCFDAHLSNNRITCITYLPSPLLPISSKSGGLQKLSVVRCAFLNALKLAAICSVFFGLVHARQNWISLKFGLGTVLELTVPIQGECDAEQSSGVLGMSLKRLQTPNKVNVQATHERDLQHYEGSNIVCKIWV